MHSAECNAASPKTLHLSPTSAHLLPIFLTNPPLQLSSVIQKDGYPSYVVDACDSVVAKLLIEQQKPPPSTLAAPPSAPPTKTFDTLTLNIQPEWISPDNGTTCLVVVSRLEAELAEGRGETVWVGMDAEWCEALTPSVIQVRSKDATHTLQLSLSSLSSLSHLLSVCPLSMFRH